jgi:putative addiction module killer protein
LAVVQIRQTATFSNRLTGLRDRRAAARIAVRLERLAAGNPGDVKPVGEGVRSGSTMARATASTSCGAGQN